MGFEKECFRVTRSHVSSPEILVMDKLYINVFGKGRSKDL